jgi:hypothetical protein
MECVVLPFLNGLTPLSDKPNLKFSGLAANSGNFLSMCAYADESMTDLMTFGSEWLLWCHWRSFDIAGDLYIHLSLIIKGKCLTTHAGIVLDPGVYL